MTRAVSIVEEPDPWRASRKWLPPVVIDGSFAAAGYAAVSVAFPFNIVLVNEVVLEVCVNANLPVEGLKRYTSAALISAPSHARKLYGGGKFPRRCVLVEVRYVRER